MRVCVVGQVVMRGTDVERKFGDQNTGKGGGARRRIHTNKRTHTHNKGATASVKYSLRLETTVCVLLSHITGKLGHPLQTECSYETKPVM